ncbi:MAG: 4-hydroxy-tetrahydrodipicolinate synthase [Culturomica sp.]|jgi:4-hydroxy-tetrahydrodipicolinate synthase|nr:4-hydroxy-tetrahydrodipicolinate synthase [Culturomica sp.]
MKISGMGVALATPFKFDGSLDEFSLRKLIDYVVEGGADFLVALGTTSEAATMSVSERYRVMEIVLEQNNGRLPVMVGLGGNCTRDVAEAVGSFPYLKYCHSILCVTPYYNKPSQEGLYQHFKTVAESAAKPVCLYNVPGRTSVNMSAETTIRISHDCPNVFAIKEACGDLQQMTEILRDVREGFTVFSGDDGNALPFISMGGHGVISVIGNLFPREFSNMIKLSLEGHFQEGSKLHLKLAPFYRLLFKEGNPAGVKACLHAKGVINENVLRLPLTPVSSELYDKMKALLYSI